LEHYNALLRGGNEPFIGCRTGTRSVWMALCGLVKLEEAKLDRQLGAGSERGRSDFGVEVEEGVEAALELGFDLLS